LSTNGYQPAWTLATATCRKQPSTGSAEVSDDLMEATLYMTVCRGAECGYIGSASKLRSWTKARQRFAAGPSEPFLPGASRSGFAEELPERTSLRRLGSNRLCFHRARALGRGAETCPLADVGHERFDAAHFLQR